MAPLFFPDNALEFVKANYTKYEYFIQTRAGAHLFTSVYVPKDATPTNKHPVLFDRTPYSVSPYGVDNYKANLGPSELFGKEKYIFVYQDVRGRMMSEGTFIDMRPRVNSSQPISAHLNDSENGVATFQTKTPVSAYTLL